MLRSLLARAALALPSQCAICRAWPAEPVCQACCDRFGRPRARCAGCALPVATGLFRCGACLKDPPPLDTCLAATDYAYPWNRCIAAFKFQHDAGWAAPLAALMATAPGAAEVLQRADLVLPVPLSLARLRERGFNQAWELARRLAPGRADAGLLLRTRDTAPQHALDRAARRRNLAHAFVADPLRSQLLRQARVLLVDDVMTSGATLYAAADALRAAGAARVEGLVFARTEEPGR